MREERRQLCKGPVVRHAGNSRKEEEDGEGTKGPERIVVATCL